jgi:hypothetical protein
LKEEAQDRTLWSTQFGRGYGPACRQTTTATINPSSRTMALGSTQPLTEMSTRNLPGDKKWPALKTDNLAAICDPNV